MSDSSKLSATVAGYVDTLLKTSTPDGGFADGTAPGGEYGDYTFDILNEYNPDLLEAVEEKMRGDQALIARCEKFITEHADLIDRALEDGTYSGYFDIGSDLLLSQHRHGTGFWDRGLGEIGTSLTEAAHAFPENVSIWVIPEGTTVAAATDIAYEES